MGVRRGHLHWPNKGGLVTSLCLNLDSTQQTQIFCSWMFVFPGCDVHSGGQWLSDRAEWLEVALQQLQSSHKYILQLETNTFCYWDKYIRCPTGNLIAATETKHQHQNQKSGHWIFFSTIFELWKIRSAENDRFQLCSIPNHINKPHPVVI